MRFMFNARGWLAMAVALLLGAATANAAGVEVNADANNLMLRGYDPVAYFTEGKPVQGKEDITATHDGLTYRFASTANRDAFAKDPAHYGPQYGGFCAMGVALGKKLNGDPELWKVVDDKLYVIVNPDAYKAWQQDIPGNLVKSEHNWPGIKARPASEL